MLKKKLGVEVIERVWDSSITDYFKISSTLIIQFGCKKVGNFAFDGCLGLKKVIIPSSVEEIGFCAFRNCHDLKKAVIPESVVEIEEWAFSYCWRATIILQKPKNKYKLGLCALWDCKDVKEEVGN